MKIIFSAGGTGGHLYPALALADYIKKRRDVEVLFVGSKYRIEATKVIEYGYDFIGLDLKTPSGNIIKKLKGYYDVFRNVSVAKKIIEDFKPDIVIGFGGYTSYSVLKAAQDKKIPTILHEQNSIIGRSNKALAKNVDALISAYDISEQVNTRNLHNLGNPTSYHVIQSQLANLNDYGLSNELPTLLIVMGSQGSKTIDNVVYYLLNDLTNRNELDFQIIYVSGYDYFKRYQDKEFSNKIKVIAYEDKLVSLIKACDLIVSRAGASALTEIISANKPSILIPSIHVTNNHQYHNAKWLVEVECAILCEENENLKENLKQNILELINNEKQLNSMSKATKLFNYNDSALNIYELILEIVGENSEG